MNSAITSADPYAERSTVMPRRSGALVVRRGAGYFEAGIIERTPGAAGEHD